MADLDLIRTLVAVYRSSSMTRAAHELGLTQAAVSKRIQSLEVALDRPLFRRVGRGIEATAAAHSFVTRVAPLIDELQRSYESTRRGGTALGGQLLLGGPSELLSELLLPAMAPLMSQGLRPICRFGLTDELLAALGAGELDLVIATGRSRQPGVELVPWIEEDFVLVGAPGFRTCLSDARSPADVVDTLPVAVYADKAPIVRRYWREVFGARPPSRPALVAPDLRALRAVLLAGAAISVLPLYLVSDALEHGTLVDLLPGRRPAANALYLAHRRRGPRAERTDQVVAWLIERAPALQRRLRA